MFHQDQLWRWPDDDDDDDNDENYCNDDDDNYYNNNDGIHDIHDDDDGYGDKDDGDAIWQKIMTSGQKTGVRMNFDLKRKKNYSSLFFSFFLKASDCCWKKVE